MNLNLISEPVEPEAIWIGDIVNGIVRESMKKALNLVAVTDGRIHDHFYGRDDERSLVLVVGYSLAWINETLQNLTRIGCEPILVSIYDSRFCGKNADSTVSFAAVNTTSAIRELVSYCVANERRNIALFGFHRDTVGDIAKLTGYAEGLRLNGIAFSRNNIYSRGKIAQLAEQFMSKINSYDAVICTNDLLAIYLINYFEARGIHVPDDIFVTGFGNWNVVKSLRPGLTRMYTDLGELGALAVRLHQYMQYNPQIRHASSVLECVLQISESTGFLPYSGQKSEVRQLSAPSLFDSTPLYSSDSDIMEVLKSELFIRGSDEIDMAILRGILEGLRYQDISETECISESTVKYRLARMQKVCGFADRQELIAFAEKYRILLYKGVDIQNDRT